MFCKTIGTRCPIERTFESCIISTRKDLIFGKPGHPDQISYIVTWEDLLVKTVYLHGANKQEHLF